MSIVCGNDHINNAFELHEFKVNVTHSASVRFAHIASCPCCFVYKLNQLEALLSTVLATTSEQHFLSKYAVCMSATKSAA